MMFSQFANVLLKASTIIGNQIPLAPTTSGVTDFHWDLTPASKSLQWHDCFDEFKCARLQIPMDWHYNTSEADKTVELAVIKLEATVPVTHPTYAGPVFFNPGGPGGSGVSQILKGGHSFRTILSAGPGQNASTARNHDVFAFDPRGVNNTRPILACFPDHVQAAQWELEKYAEGFIGDSDSSFDNLWARFRALAEGCSQRGAETGLAKHVSTAVVARDVVELFERHGEWRAVEAERLLRSSKGYSREEREAILTSTAYRRGQEPIQYWGFSYGTILGAHIAAIYPERVHRLIADGVADSFDYMAAGWQTNLINTDMIFVKLAEYCWLGGREHCLLWHDDGPAAIMDNIMAILRRFRQEPIATPGNATYGPTFVSYHDYEAVMSKSLYSFLTNAPELIQTIYEVGQGQSPTLVAAKKAKLPELGRSLTKACLQDGPYSLACVGDTGLLSDSASYAIACSDGMSRTRDSKEQFKEYARGLIDQSALIGNQWAEIMLPCTAWHARPAWRYNGNFTARTRNPILFIGNTYDPVTPLQNCFTMTKGFQGSGVLHQDSEGHCSYRSVSMCTGKAIRHYFQTGELPVMTKGRNSALCEPDLLPLQGYGKGSKPDIPSGQTDQELWDALIQLNQT